MNYELVQLEEKKVAGLSIRTQNNDPDMSRSIEQVWKRFFEDGIYHSIDGKKNDKTIGLYTNYENGVDGAYDMMVCCEVNDTASLPENVIKSSERLQMAKPKEISSYGMDTGKNNFIRLC